jgi:hypothetical protein
MKTKVAKKQLIQFNYQRFKKTGKFYEECFECVEIDKNKLDSAFYIYEEIKKLRLSKKDDMLWLIGADDSWFYDIEIRKIVYPIIIGL